MENKETEKWLWNLQGVRKMERIWMWHNVYIDDEG